MCAVLLGTGSPPPNPRRRGPSALLSLGDERFLVDAGSGVGAQLVQAGVRPLDWPRVFITHHHSDHTIDLGHLLITRWISGQNAPFEVWGHLVRWSHGADCLIHECCEMARTTWFPGCGWPTLEDKIRDLASYHTQPPDVGRVARDARVKKLVITHLMPGSVPAELAAAAQKDFAGAIAVGEDLAEV